MPNPKIIYPANYTPAQALAFANADNTAATVSASAPLPVTHGDGAMVSLGAMADAAAASDTGTASLIALFKRLLGKFPASIGQKTAANSLPVVLASDRSAISINSDGVVDGALVTASVTSATTVVALNMAGYNGGSFQISSVGSGNTVTFEQSNDNTNWVLLPVNTASNTNAGSATTATAVGIYNFAAATTYVRARVSTYGSGTVTITATPKRSRMLAEQVGNVVLATGSAQIGYVVNTLGYTDSSTVLAASATFTGTSRATTSLPYVSRFKARAFADQAGTLYIEQSLDTGTTWQVVATGSVVANIVVDLNVAVTGALGAANLYRVRYVNGATVQTLFRLSSCYSSN